MIGLGKARTLARRYHGLIADDVKADTRKLASYEAFLTSLSGTLHGSLRAGRFLSNTLDSLEAFCRLQKGLYLALNSREQTDEVAHRYSREKLETSDRESPAPSGINLSRRVDRSHSE